MKATDVRVGDTMQRNGSTVYTVVGLLDRLPDQIKVRVEYADGGDGIRVWYPDDETPLTRGSR